jgi:hypothetical protein
VHTGPQPVALQTPQIIQYNDGVTDERIRELKIFIEKKDKLGYRIKQTFRRGIRDIVRNHDSLDSV